MNKKSEKSRDIGALVDAKQAILALGTEDELKEMNRFVITRIRGLREIHAFKRKLSGEIAVGVCVTFEGRRGRVLVGVIESIGPRNATVRVQAGSSFNDNGLHHVSSVEAKWRVAITMLTVISGNEPHIRLGA